MSSTQPSRAELLDALMVAFRQSSAATVLFHQAIADRLGLNATDHKCADILERSGPITAGELAKLTGLTTGAITGVVDRLEKAGFVRRAEDPDDRRRVVLEPQSKQMAKVMGPLFESMGKAAATLCEKFRTDELLVIREFTLRANDMTLEETRKLREGMSDSPTTRAKKPPQM